MNPPYPAFDEERCRRLLDERNLGIGRPLFVLSVTGSTNDDALNAAKAGAAHGATFVAERQTAGRGRRGHRWSSAPGESLTFSVLLRPKLTPERASAFTLAVGLAVRDASAARVRTPISIKWPNDVLASERKLAGVLVESQVQGTALSALIVGVGLNVHTKRLPEDLSDMATSLALLGAENVDRELLLCDLLARIEARLLAYERSGLAPLLPELRSHDALYGRRVRIDGTTGIARGIDHSGALLVETGNGEVRSTAAGTVERLPES